MNFFSVSINLISYLLHFFYLSLIAVVNIPFESPSLLLDLSWAEESRHHLTGNFSVEVPLTTVLLPPLFTGHSCYYQHICVKHIFNLSYISASSVAWSSQNRRRISSRGHSLLNLAEFIKIVLVGCRDTHLQNAKVPLPNRQAGEGIVFHTNLKKIWTKIQIHNFLVTYNFKTIHIERN